MRKYHTEKETTTKDVKVFDYMECDICGHRTAYYHYQSSNWSDDAYGVEAVKVQYKSGDHFPGDTFYGTKTTFDICPKCFTEKLLPFIKSLGAEPRVKKGL